MFRIDTDRKSPTICLSLFLMDDDDDGLHRDGDLFMAYGMLVLVGDELDGRIP